jgi:hypothetical protein
MVAAKQKHNTIDAELAEFEKRLRLQLLKEKLAAIDRAEYSGGAVPQIHVSVGALAASAAQAPAQHASGD